MALRASRREVLRDALSHPREETFERVLGRAVRRHGGQYADYLALIAEVRETARTRRVEVREAARLLADQP